jgi:hypothetical protein
MKPLPPVPRNTDAERMDDAVRKLFTISKDDYLKEEARRTQAKEETGEGKSE